MSIIVFQSRISTYRSLEGSGGPEVGCGVVSWLVPFRFGAQIEVYHLESGTSNIAAGQLHSLTVWELLVSWGKDLRLPVGLAFWGFGAATELIATPITLVAELLLTQWAPGDFDHRVWQTLNSDHGGRDGDWFYAGAQPVSGISADLWPIQRWFASLLPKGRIAYSDMAGG